MFFLNFVFACRFLAFSRKVNCNPQVLFRFFLRVFIFLLFDVLVYRNVEVCKVGSNFEASERSDGRLAGKYDTLHVTKNRLQSLIGQTVFGRNFMICRYQILY